MRNISLFDFDSYYSSFAFNDPFTSFFVLYSHVQISLAQMFIN
jgi:hypothetical protein